MLLRRGDHRLAFDDVVAVGLLDVHVLAGLAGMDRRQGVPVVGRADDQGVERLVVQRLAKVLDRLGRLPVALLDASDARGSATRSSMSQTYRTSTSGSEANVLSTPPPRPRTPIMQIEILSLAA